MSKDKNNVYIKVGRKYEPIGVTYYRDYLTDGLWLVRHYPGHSAYDNVNYLRESYGLTKVSSGGDYTDLSDIAKLAHLEDVICKGIQEVLHTGVSIAEIAKHVVKKIVENGK